MIKKLLPFLTVCIIIFLIVSLFISLSQSQNMTVVSTGNTDKKPIEIILGKFQDSDCGMVIDDISYASEVVSPTGKTWFFHDHGGMVHWLENKEFKESAIIWVYSRDTRQWIDGRGAFYSRNEITPMLYGFGAYEFTAKNRITFQEMSLHMLRGEHLGNPKMKNIILQEIQ